MEHLQYPIGKFDFDQKKASTLIDHYIGQLEEFPHIWHGKVASASAHQLEQVYRPGGWTLKQLIHHVPDSHLNAYVRFKWALTEDNPTIKAYDEARWAELNDKNLPIQASLDLLKAIHAKWTSLMRLMHKEDWDRTFHHPESGSTNSLLFYLAHYDWHARHHLGHLGLVLG